MTAAAAARGSGGGGGALAGLGAGIQSSALLQVSNHRLAQEPELPPALGRDLLVGSELTQTLMADVQFFGGHGQQDQPVLHHGADSSAYAKSLPRRGLPLAKITGKMIGVIPSNKEDLPTIRCVLPPCPAGTFDHLLR